MKNSKVLKFPKTIPFQVVFSSPLVMHKGGIFEAGFGEKLRFLGHLWTDLAKKTLGQVKSVPNFY